MPSRSPLHRIRRPAAPPFPRSRTPHHSARLPALAAASDFDASRHWQALVDRGLIGAASPPDPTVAADRLGCAGLARIFGLPQPGRPA